jgi:hypothetical protein
MIVETPWYMPNMVFQRDLQTPTVKEEIQHYSSQLQLQLQCSPQCTPKQPSKEPHGATRQQQEIAKTAAK